MFWPLPTVAMRLSLVLPAKEPKAEKCAASGKGHTGVAWMTQTFPSQMLFSEIFTENGIFQNHQPSKCIFFLFFLSNILSFIAYWYFLETTLIKLTGVIYWVGNQGPSVREGGGRLCHELSSFSPAKSNNI